MELSHTEDKSALRAGQIEAYQVAGRPFSITITARDALSQPIPYTGTTILSDTTGTLALTHPGPCSGTLQLRCAGPFVDGTWSGQVSIAGPGPAIVIEATTGAATGSSNTFAVRQRIHLPLVLRTE